jgi:hypothetical protein
MKCYLAFAVLILTASLAGQVEQIEHAPTVAQCQADQRLWDYQITNQAEKLPDIKVLQKWNREMGECESIDPSNKLPYFVTVDEVDGEMLIRMMHYLQRHDTLKEFVHEDEAGKR